MNPIVSTGPHRANAAVGCLVRRIPRQGYGFCQVGEAQSGHCGGGCQVVVVGGDGVTRVILRSLGNGACFDLSDIMKTTNYGIRFNRR